MIYLLLGEDLKSKDAKIALIKSKAISNSQDANFDLENLDAIGLAADALKKALLTLPVFARKRLVIVRNIQKLKAADVTSLMEFARKPADYLDVVLESCDTAFKGELKDLPGLCVTTAFTGKPQANVFDMTKLMSAGKAKEALGLLNGFYTDGVHPLQIMGGLVWFWGKEGRALSKPKFKQGLQSLEDADLNIKRSRMDAEYAVEKVVVELTGLLGRR